ncbi:tetratricopeptide repeat protein [Flammeovirgaceae bacterium SG7u.111]|nr:tetratricopeptide repeat protein [Flammeovirgaceae bacterium SG7u.132]WPO35659.1 tetratricopeptide repeat protein [Flammeovirgaceae bacterium SG7u.111]
MKKFLIVMFQVSLLFVAVNLYGQEIKKPSEAKALAHLSKGELDLAKAHIDGYFAEPKNEKKLTKGKPWVTKGKVYAAIATSDNSDYQKLSDNPLEVAMEAFNKVKELEKEASLVYMEVWGPPLPGQNPAVDQLYAHMFEAGVNDFNSDNLEGAIANFEKALIIFPADTNSVLNIINAGYNIEDNDVVMKYAKKLIDMEYPKDFPYRVVSQLIFTEAQPFQEKIDEYEGDLRNLYLEVRTAEDSTKVKDEASAIQTKLDKATASAHEVYEKALEYVNTGLEKFPQSQDLRTQQINSYLKLGRDEDAISAMEQALAEKPDDKQLHFNLGVLYDRIGNLEKSAEAYKKAIELDSEYFDAVFNLGAAYYTAGNKYINEGNEFIDMMGNYTDDKGKELHEKGKDLFTKAIPYFEKTNELKPEDRQALEVLYRLHKVLEHEDKAKAIMDQLNALPE